MGKDGDFANSSRTISHKLTLAAKNADRACDATRAVKLVRQNVRAAWQLERDQKQFEEERMKMQNSFERKERALLLSSEQTRKSSGRLVNDLDLLTIGLPCVILSPSTTKRSRLPWQEKNRRGELSTSVGAKSASNKPQVLHKGGTRSRSSLMQPAPALPRLQRAIQDSKKEISDVAIFCKRVQWSKKKVKKINPDLLDSHARGLSEEEDVKGEFLTVPKQRACRIPTTIFANWAHDESDPETNANTETESSETSQISLHIPELGTSQGHKTHRVRSTTFM